MKQLEFWVIFSHLFWYLMSGKQNPTKLQNWVIQQQSFITIMFMSLCICNLSFTFILTLSRSERVAFKAPSGRPNGKQYLKKRKFFRLCNLLYFSMKHTEI